MKKHKREMITAAADKAIERLRNAHVYGVREDLLHRSATDDVYVQFERSFTVSGSVSVTFQADSDRSRTFRPVVHINFPASAKTALQATSFMALVQELTLLGASLQVELDELGPLVAGAS